MQFLFNWLVSAIALLISAYIIPGVSIDNIIAALVAVVVLGLINAFLKPILIILTLPVTIITLGLFTVVINALLVLLAASIVPGFHISGFLSALLFSIVLSLVNMLFSSWSRPRT